MFTNIGGKIKTLAKVVCWVGIILSVIIGLTAIIGGNSVNSFTIDGVDYGKGAAVSGVVGGIFTMVIGSLCSWIGSFVLYGFGELIAQTAENGKKLDKLNMDK